MARTAKSLQPTLAGLAPPEAVRPLPPRIFAGTSGWAYPSWKPEFYPKDVPAKRFLEHYGSRLNSVEVNYTFRAFPTASMLTGWLAATPAEFRFSFKAPQRITHFKQLRNTEDLVRDFVTALAPVSEAGRLGVLLFQLPPSFKANIALLAEFLAAPALKGVRVAFEFRHASWFTEETYAVLREHDAAMCIAESDELQTPDVQCSTSFACYRLRRESGYTAELVEEFAARFTALAENREVFVYFKHEEDPSGALNAEAFLNACVAKAAQR